MRLTLRTLLAWLDDTLPPGEVRQIGQQVVESPLAGELVDKIHRVTRQRRLTVPPGTGADGVDANIVAGYLDDELPTEIVGEYEKRCLTSDVTLAEVASVHQILSLLGQKAKVPAEAKQRMYHLIKGREAAPTPTSRPSTRKAEPKAVTAWSPDPMPSRSVFERYGPLAAVAGLILLLGWSAYMSVGPTKVAPEIANAPKPPAPKTKLEVVPEAPDVKVEQKAATPVEIADKPTVEKSKDPEPSTIPAGSAGVVGQGEFVLLRQGAQPKSWDRVAPGTTLRDHDRILNLAPYLTPVQVGSARLTLIGACEIVVHAPREGTVAHFELIRGHVKVSGTATKDPIALDFDSNPMKLTVPEGAIAGLEVLHRRAFGEPIPGSPGLRIFGTEGTVTIEAAGMKEELTSALIGFLAPKTFGGRAGIDPIPSWLTDTALLPEVQRQGTEFAAYFKPDRTPKSCLVEAVDDPSPGVRAVALSGLADLGQLDMVVSTMSQKDNPKSRKAAIGVLRDVAKRSAESAKELRNRLESVGGSKEWSDDVEAMLVGYPPRAATEDAMTARLLKLLTHDDVGVRELAIDTLQSISNRGDRMGYDPEKASDPDGVKAWADLVERKELLPAAPKPR